MTKQIDTYSQDEKYNTRQLHYEDQQTATDALYDDDTTDSDSGYDYRRNRGGR